jgi:RNA polymerase sigma-70 factor (ECF subfamily)
MNSQGSHTDHVHGDQAMRALLRRVGQRDKAAFRALYHALYPLLGRYLFRLIGRADDVEELLNDVMWVVWEKAGEFRGESQVTTWVLGIATRKTYRWRAQWRRQQTLVERQILERQMEAFGATTATTAITDDLAASLEQLSSEHRQTLELAYYCGYSCEEIALMMECPIGTVKTRLHYARKRLRQLLESSAQTYGDVL